MVENIYAIKNRILNHIEREAEDLNRINVKELGEMVDMVKDLAEAEKNCWEASYYKATSEAMDSYSGYSGGSMTTARSGYSNGMRSGYQEDSDKDDIIGMLGSEYHSLSPDERRTMRKKVFAALGIK